MDRNYQKELETVQNPLVKEKLLNNIGHILSMRVVKLETLPKSYVTYLLDAITKSTIAQYTMEKTGN